MGKLIKESFIIHTDDSECIDALSDEQAGRLFKALLAYSKSGAFPDLSGAELMAFLFMKKQLDRDNEKYRETCEKRRLAGAMGGRPKKEKAIAFFENQEKAEKPDSDNETETETDTDIKEECPPAKKACGRYKNVFLTEEELETVRAEFPNDWQKRVDRLSEYVEQTGKRYKSHLATLRIWARKETEKQEKARDGTAFDDNSYDSKSLELISRGGSKKAVI